MSSQEEVVNSDNEQQILISSLEVMLSYCHR